MLCKGIVAICETTGGGEIKGRREVEPIRSRKGEKRRGRKEGERKCKQKAQMASNRKEQVVRAERPERGSPHHCLAPRQLSTRKL